MPRPTTKVCHTCGKELPIDAYAIRDKNCLSCREEIIAAWQRENAGKIRSIPTDESDPQ